MEERKFYKTIIEVEVLSEEPYDPETLAHIHYDITEGECSGEWSVKSAAILTAKEMAAALEAQGSDPSFFFIDEEE